VAVALAARELLAEEGIPVVVVSMPSWELFAAQDRDYRRAVLPPELPTVAIEAGVSQGWERWADRTVAVDRFGASAPGAEVLRRLGVTPQAAAAAVRDVLRA
jgi:transketolase